MDDAANYLFQPWHCVIQQPEPQPGERQHRPPAHEQVQGDGAEQRSGGGGSMRVRAKTAPRLGWGHGTGAGTALPWLQGMVVCKLASFERSHFLHGYEKQAASLALRHTALCAAPFPP